MPSKKDLEVFKSKLYAQYELAVDRYESLSKRNAWLVKLSIVVVIFLMWQIFFLNPALQEIQRLSSRMSVLSQFNFEQPAKLANAEAAFEKSTHSSLEGLITEKKREIALLDEAIAYTTSRFTDPQDLYRVVGDLFNEESVTLSTLEAMPEASISVAGDTDPAVGKIKRHSISINMQGKYFDVLDYFRTLGNRPTRLLYDSIELNLKDYPINDVSFTVYTMTLQQPETYLANEINQLPAQHK